MSPLPCFINLQHRSEEGQCLKHREKNGLEPQSSRPGRSTAVGHGDAVRESGKGGQEGGGGSGKPLRVRKGDRCLKAIVLPPKTTQTNTEHLSGSSEDLL